MSTTTLETPAGAPDARATEWQHRNPGRWAREITELDATGWTYRVTRQSRGLGLMVIVPLAVDAEGARRLAAPGETNTPPLRLQVRFPQTYPTFAPDIYDPDGALAGLRHRNPVSGQLCLIHDEDWHAETTVAELLRTQLPRLLATNVLGAGDQPAAGLEFPVPEAATALVTNHHQPILITDHPVPAGVDSGALLARFVTDKTHLGPGVVEAIYGPGLELHTDLSEHQMTQFKMPVLGRWVRDPDYTPDQAPGAVWKRIQHRLAPLEVEVEGGAKASAMNPEAIEVIGLLVPDETTYRGLGESWVFLAGIKFTQNGRTRRRVIRLGTQYLSRELLAERTPVARLLADKSVVVIGLGSVGMPIALDLAQSGVGSITVFDRDVVDPTTLTRQSGGSLSLTGVPKVSLAKMLMEDAAPYCRVEAVSGTMENLWDPVKDPANMQAALKMRRVLASADLVIDATANPPVTRLLDRIRGGAGKPLLVATGTAGGWGGVVTLLTPATGCWACVEHHRIDQTLPVPPADPNGWVSPTRCAHVTFTGARHQMQQIALHASAVAVGHLAGAPMDGDYYAASMRTPDDRPAPITWTTADLPEHSACPLHTPGSSIAAAARNHVKGDVR